MKICPACQKKNEDSDFFCEKCGQRLASSLSFQGEGNKKGRPRRPRWVLISLIFVAIVLGGVVYRMIEGHPDASPRIAAVEYSGQTVGMTDISVKVENGKISIPLNLVKEKKIVRFEYVAKDSKIPLLCYVTLTGRVVTAISMCEPCRSTRFHIQEKALVCNTCNTEWHLENLKGIKGGCLKYPPEAIPNTVQKDRILIDEKVVAQWKPRV